MVLLADFVAPLAVFSVGALAPLLRDSLYLSREQIGSLTAFFFAGAALAGIPVGWIADRFGVRRFLSAVQAVNGLGLIAVLLLHTYAEILAGDVPRGPVTGLRHGLDDQSPLRMVPP